jgi:hypothetical protein
MRQFSDSHSSRGSLTTAILKTLDVSFPQLEVQKRISSSIYCLDKKIALNRQINQILESMAQTIFKSWFVDFEPVKAKIAAIEAGEDTGGVTRAAMRAISGKTDDELNQMQAGQPDEVAFYDALANNESAVRELGDEILKKIAVEIIEKLRKSTTVDWQVRDSVRAKLRILVRRTLQRYKYPPDKANDAIELVLKQAEVLSNAWTH